jgi:hypothetical protein
MADVTCRLGTIHPTKVLELVSSTYANILKYHIQGMPTKLYYRCLYSN